MTLMCIPVCSDIGLEIHKDTDQIIRIEQGMALVKMGVCEKIWIFRKRFVREIPRKHIINSLNKAIS